MSDNRLMQEEAEHPPRFQFRVRHLLLLTAAIAVALGVYRWILMLNLPPHQQRPLMVWSGCALVLATTMGWILLTAKRRLEISPQRLATLLIGMGPIGYWLIGLAAIASRSPEGEAPHFAMWACTAGLALSGACFFIVSIAVVVNLWRKTDLLLLIVQILIVTLIFAALVPSIEMRLVR